MIVKNAECSGLRCIIANGKCERIAVAIKLLLVNERVFKRLPALFVVSEGCPRVCRQPAENLVLNQIPDG